MSTQGEWDIKSLSFGHELGAIGRDKEELKVHITVLDARTVMVHCPAMKCEYPVSMMNLSDSMRDLYREYRELMEASE